LGTSGTYETEFEDLEGRPIRRGNLLKFMKGTIVFVVVRPITDSRKPKIIIFIGRNFLRK
jgi:hypothetical protein